jgi:hypothetical protein
VTINKVCPSLFALSIFLVFVRPYLKVNDVSLAPCFHIGDKIEDGMILGQAIKENLVALVCQELGGG